MYKSGYDPGAFVDFFEKIQSLEKKKPGTMAKVFSTHPMTEDRITTAQKNIQEYLKERPEYVVTTSEFNDVKTRLMAMHNKRKVDTTGSESSHAAQGPRGQHRRRQRRQGRQRRRPSDPEAPPRSVPLRLTLQFFSSFGLRTLTAQHRTARAASGRRPVKVSRHHPSCACAPTALPGSTAL